MNRSRLLTRRALACAIAIGAALLGAFGLPTLTAQPSAEPIKFAHTPHIANDGRMAFSYHQDIWVADGDGSHAATADRAPGERRRRRVSRPTASGSRSRATAPATTTSA